ncbi:flagellar hook-length control protein FliK [Pseudoalteromonas sp. ASV78]|uniref:flagellar hook-length control protein FliK n=1 Tax=Pseudoalteromonas sp. ASV78 TaxID=3397851 RepID=UPI0039FC7558
MNKPTQITLANSLSVSHSSHNGAGQQIPVLSEQTLSAKNIVFAKGSVQLEVYVDKHWQTLRLATTESQSTPARIASADIQLSHDGKQLTILPTQTAISLHQTKQLQSILNFINSGDQLNNKPLSLQIILQPAAKLLLNQLDASIPVNKELAQLLHNETGLKAIITPNSRNFTLSIVNRFADTLHQQPISQAKLAVWLTKLVPQGQLQLDKNTITLSFNNYNGNLKLTVPPSDNQLHSQHQANTVTQKVQLIAVNEQLIIKTQQPKIALLLKNSLTHTFQALVQKSQLSTPTNFPTTPASPSLVSSSPISSWLQHSFADLKTRINDAVRYFESKPFSQLSPSSAKPSMATSTQQLTQAPQTEQTLLPKSLTRINLAALAVNHPQPLQADISQATSLPKNFHQAPPLVQIFQQLKAGLASITQAIQLPMAVAAPLQPNKTALTEPVHKNIPATTEQTKATSAVNSQNIAVTSPQKQQQAGPLLSSLNPSSDSKPIGTATNHGEALAKTVKNAVAGQSIQKNDVQPPLLATTAKVSTNKTEQLATLSLPTQLKGPLTTGLPISQLSLPLEAKLLASLLKTPLEKPLPNFNTTTARDRQQVAAQIDKFINTKVSDNVDLNRLVNHAFSRMIDSQSLQPLTIQREILSVLRPESLTPSALQNSFSQSLEHLAVGILATPSLANISALNFNSQSSLDALLQVLVPNFKATNPQKLQEQLLQPQSQALAAELSQIKTAISQVNSTPLNQQSDTNPLVQFLLPMRLPPDTAQTEISLGQYKKPSKDQLEGKNVWFVRLNFDYAELGQLQITAELMDKALDCQLLASSQEVTAMAHPHLESLRHKLTAHGLQVGELALSQGAPQHQAFYQSHAIINIKV